MHQPLAYADALVLPDLRAVTQGDVERVHVQAGLLVMPETLRTLAPNLHRRQRIGSYWVQMVDALRADLRSYGQADPAALQSRVPAHPPPPIQGTPTPLPVTQFGASGQATTVVVGQTPSSRSRPRRPRPPARRLRTPPCPRADAAVRCHSTTVERNTHKEAVDKQLRLRHSALFFSIPLLFFFSFFLSFHKLFPFFFLLLLPSFFSSL